MSHLHAESLMLRIAGRLHHRSTIVTRTVCSCLCSNESWVYNSGYLAGWFFDGTFNDINNIYNPTSYNNLSFLTNGYANQAQILASHIFNSSDVAIWGPSIPMVPVWSHIVQIWSPTNDLRLYINNVLVAFQASAVAYAASGLSNFVTLSNSINGHNYCAGGGFGNYAPGPLTSDMDDFRLYSRELTTSDISTIYYSR